jgi:hypothetical protein
MCLAIFRRPSDESQNDQKSEEGPSAPKSEELTSNSQGVLEKPTDEPGLHPQW